MKSTVHTIYGKNGSISLLKSNKFSITDIFTMEGGSAYKDKALRAQINKSKCRAISLSKDEFNKRFGHKRTQGIVVNFILTYKDVEDINTLDENHCIITIDGINDPQNLGQIIRTAECAGVNALILPSRGSVSITNSVLQVSQGAFCNLDIIVVNNLNSSIADLKKKGYWVTGFENSIEASMWYEIDYRGKTLFVFGGEGTGIKKLTREKCDNLATIPMNGEISSLNVSSTVSAVLFERNRQILKEIA